MTSRRRPAEIGSNLSGRLILFCYIAYSDKCAESFVRAAVIGKLLWRARVIYVREQRERERER